MFRNAFKSQALTLGYAAFPSGNEVRCEKIGIKIPSIPNRFYINATKTKDITPLLEAAINNAIKKDVEDNARPKKQEIKCAPTMTLRNERSSALFVAGLAAALMGGHNYYKI